MVKSLVKITIIITLIFSSFLIYNTNYTTSIHNTQQEITFGNSSTIVDEEIVISDFKVTPYEENYGSQAARTGPQSYVVLLVHFSDYTTPRWTKAEHED
ncbi:MAG: hypothetical protein ACTSSB_14860, partial [Candidatus Heimdallarchaeota archaeon]